MISWVYMLDDQIKNLANTIALVACYYCSSLVYFQKLYYCAVVRLGLLMVIAFNLVDVY